MMALPYYHHTNIIYCIDLLLYICIYNAGFNYESFKDIRRCTWIVYGRQRAVRKLHVS